MFRKAILSFLLFSCAAAVFAQTDVEKRFGIVSLREIVKQVPLQELAVYCKTNDWGESYSRINTRLIELTRKLEDPMDSKLEQSLRDQRYRLEAERNQLENSIRGVSENVVRQFIADEFSSAFHIILNKDDDFEILYTGLEVSDITSQAIKKLRTKFAEKVSR